MIRVVLKAVALSGAAVLLLGACAEGDDNGGGVRHPTDSSDPVMAEMSGWGGCAVLRNDQPIVDFMGIKEWVGTTGRPSTFRVGGNNLDPEALGCAGGIDLGSFDKLPADGELRVKIVPTENEDQAATAYSQRIGLVEELGDKETERFELSDPWDAGMLRAARSESDATEYLGIVARDGQWVVHIYLTFTADYNGLKYDKPDYQFTSEELHQWFAETYLPEVNQTVHDRL